MYVHYNFPATPNFDLNLNSITKFLHNLSKPNHLRGVKQVHAHLLRSGLFFIYLNLQTQLILTYSTCLQQNNLQTLANFFNCITPINSSPFNIIISHFCRNGFPSLALRTFCFMHIRGVPIDTYALCSTLTASTSNETIRFGKQLHTLVEKLGWSSSVFVGSALIDLYATSLVTDDAAQVFDEIPVKNTVCANALLSGFAEAKMWFRGIELFRNMPRLNLVYDNITLLAALKACAGVSDIELGKQLHANCIRVVPDLGTNVFLQSSLIEMYGKCGLAHKARQVFNTSGFSRDIVLWTSIIGVHGRNGDYKEVIELYKEMVMEGIKPDGVAFIAVISACSHTGQVDLGIKYFESMALEFGLNLRSEHYGCLIDLLCRAGELDKAWKIVNEMQCKGNGDWTISIWGGLLSACNDQGNVELGELAAHRALELDPQNVGIYVLLSNLYARHSMWSEIEELRKVMKERGLKKDLGSSWVYG